MRGCWCSYHHCLATTSVGREASPAYTVCPVSRRLLIRSARPCLPGLTATMGQLAAGGTEHLPCLQVLEDGPATGSWRRRKGLEPAGCGWPETVRRSAARARQSNTAAMLRCSRRVWRRVRFTHGLFKLNTALSHLSGWMAATAFPSDTASVGGELGWDAAGLIFEARPSARPDHHRHQAPDCGVTVLSCGAEWCRP